MSVSLGSLKVNVIDFKCDGLRFSMTKQKGNGVGTNVIQKACVCASLIMGDPTTAATKKKLLQSAIKKTSLASSANGDIFEWEGNESLEFKADISWYISMELEFSTLLGSRVRSSSMLLPVRNDNKQITKVEVFINSCEYSRMDHGQTQTPPPNATDNAEQIVIGALALSIDFRPNHQSFRYLVSSIASEARLCDKVFAQNFKIVEVVLRELSHILAALEKNAIDDNDRKLLRQDLSCYEQICAFHSMSARLADFLASTSTSQLGSKRVRSAKISPSYQPSSLPVYKVSSKVKLFISALRLNLPHAPILNTDLMEKLLAIFGEEISELTSNSYVNDSASELTWEYVVLFTIALCVWYLQQSLMACTLVCSTNVIEKELMTIREIFMRYDFDASGHIQSDKLDSVLLAMGAYYTVDEVSIILSQYLDLDHVGCVDFLEFMYWWCDPDDEVPARLDSSSRPEDDVNSFYNMNANTGIDEEVSHESSTTASSDYSSVVDSVVSHTNEDVITSPQETEAKLKLVIDTTRDQDVPQLHDVDGIVNVNMDRLSRDDRTSSEEYAKAQQGLKIAEMGIPTVEGDDSFDSTEDDRSPDGRLNSIHESMFDLGGGVIDPSRRKLTAIPSSFVYVGNITNVNSMHESMFELVQQPHPDHSPSKPGQAVRSPEHSIDGHNVIKTAAQVAASSLPNTLDGDPDGDYCGDVEADIDNAKDENCTSFIGEPTKSCPAQAFYRSEHGPLADAVLDSETSSATNTPPNPEMQERRRERRASRLKKPFSQEVKHHHAYHLTGNEELVEIASAAPVPSEPEDRVASEQQCPATEVTDSIYGPEMWISEAQVEQATETMTNDGESRPYPLYHNATSPVGSGPTNDAVHDNEYVDDTYYYYNYPDENDDVDDVDQDYGYHQDYAGSCNDVCEGNVEAADEQRMQVVGEECAYVGQEDLYFYAENRPYQHQMTADAGAENSWPFPEHCQVSSSQPIYIPYDDIDSVRTGALTGSFYTSQREESDPIDDEDAVDSEIELDPDAETVDFTEGEPGLVDGSSFDGDDQSRLSISQQSAGVSISRYVYTPHGPQLL